MGQFLGFLYHISLNFISVDIKYLQFVFMSIPEFRIFQKYKILLKHVPRENRALDVTKNFLSLNENLSEYSDRTHRVMQLQFWAPDPATFPLGAMPPRSWWKRTIFDQTWTGSKSLSLLAFDKRSFVFCSWRLGLHFMPRPPWPQTLT